MQRECIKCGQISTFVMNSNFDHNKSENWKCLQCYNREKNDCLRSDNHCKICSNRLFIISNEESSNFGDEICVKCVLFDSLKKINIQKFDFSNLTELDYEEIYGFTDILKEIVATIQQNFSQDDFKKINYLQIHHSNKGGLSFDEFVCSILYAGYGNDDRKFYRLPEFISNDPGVYLFDCSSDTKLSEPICKWIEKGQIEVIFDFKEKKNGQILNKNLQRGIGRIQKNELNYLKLIGYISLYDAYMNFDNSSKVNYFDRSHFRTG